MFLQTRHPLTSSLASKGDSSDPGTAFVKKAEKMRRLGTSYHHPLCLGGREGDSARTIAPLVSLLGP